MRIIEQLVYKITGDSTSFDKSINNTSNNVTKFSKIATVALTALSVGAIVGVTKRVVEMGAEFVKVASSAQETSNKFKVTFSGIKAEADSVAKNLSDNFGLSSQKSEELLSNTGDLLTGFGFTQKGALDLAKQTNELAVDLASFTNFSGGAEGASAILTKALLGERDSMKSLGIAITEADINQLAEDKGIVGEIDRQTKAQLTLELAVKQSKNAIGDFARSEDSFANQTRILSSNIDDLKTSLGNRLLPVVTNVVTGLTNVVETIDDNLDSNKKLQTATNDITRISTDYNTILKKLNGTLSEQETLELKLSNIRNEASLKKAFEDFSEGYQDIEKLKKAFTGVGGSITLAQENVDSFTKQLKAWAQDNQIEFEPSISFKDLYAKMDEAVPSNHLKSLLQGYVENYQNLTNATTEYNAVVKSQTLSINSLGEAVANGSLNIDTLQFSNKELYDSIIASSEAYKKSRDEEIEKANKLVKAYKNETDINEKRVEQIVEILKLNMNLATSEEAKAIYLDKINKLLSINQDANKTNTNTIANRKIIIDTLNKTIEDSKRYEEALGYAYDENTALSNAYLTAIKDLIDNGENPQSEKIQEITELYKKLNPELLDNAKQIKAYQTQIRNLIDSGLSPQSDAVQDLITKLEDLGGAYKFNPSELDEFIDKLEEGANYVDLLSNSVNSLTKGFGSAFADMGEALVTGEDAWGAFASAGVGALADVVSGLGDQLTAMAVAKLISFDFVNAGLATAGAIGAYTASGALKGVANSYEVGTMDLPYNQVAQLHKGETVLTAGITEEAKTQGITIEPKNKSNKSSEMTQINVYLGSKLIASEIVKDINSGNSGTISKRVVK